MGHSKSSSKREFYSDISIPQETRKSSSKKPNLTTKGTRKRRTKPKVGKRKEIIKSRAEINEIEILKSNRKDQWNQELVPWKDKIDKPLARLINKKRERAQINNIGSEKGEVTTYTSEIQKDHKRLLQTIICQ